MADGNSLSDLIKVAGASSVVAALLTQVLGSWRERVHRRLDAKERREQRWAEFQMKTLIELQEASQNLVRGARTVAFDFQTNVPAIITMESRIQTIYLYQISEMRITSLVSLVENAEVRRSTQELQEYANGLALAHLDESGERLEAEPVLDERFRIINSKYVHVCELIGETLRSLP